MTKRIYLKTNLNNLAFLDLDSQIEKAKNSLIQKFDWCSKRFERSKCSCEDCWTMDYYGRRKNLVGRIPINLYLVKYYDKNCHRGMLNAFVPESFPLFMEFLQFDFDFSKRNPVIHSKFVPNVSRQEKTHFWKVLNTSSALVVLSLPEIDCVKNLPDNIEYIVSGVVKDASEVTTSDLSFINKVISLEKLPYALFPIERSTYSNDPHFMSIFILFNYLNSFKYYYDSNLNIIPFVIGANDEQLRFCCMVLKRWGFKNVAWSLSGINKSHNPNEIKRIRGIISEYFEQVVMVNFLSFRSGFDNSVFISPNWYLLPHLFGRRINLGSKSRICYCPFCKGEAENKIPPSNLSLCSLFKIFRYFKRDFRQTTLKEFLCHHQKV